MRVDKISISPILFLFLFLVMLFHTQAQDVYPGYAFYSSGRECRLYDMDKNLVHTWTSTYQCAGAARLCRDSSVLYSGRNPDGWSGGVLQGGQIQIINWNGELAWDFQYASSEYCPHHNIEIMYYTEDPKETPNVLLACYEKENNASELPDKLVEIKPTGKTTGEIVWQWYAWDHRTDDPYNHPELLEAPSDTRPGDWNHVNNISFNRELDQLVVDMKSFDEFVIIDHSTTIEEAAGHTGGKYGKGGDILYRWGQASNYGISGNDYIVGFHAGCWIPYVFPGTNIEMPGAGNVMFFHNDRDEVVEVTLPGNGDGIYPRNPGEAYGPDSPTWTYDMTNPGQHEGSVQRLPNGNTFICDANSSIYEVTSGGQTVWSLSARCIQAYKYDLKYLDQTTPIKEKNVSAQKTFAPKVYSNPATSKVHISFNNLNKSAEINIFAINGKKILSKIVDRNLFIWNAKNQPSGIYIVKLKIEESVFNKYINLIR